MKVRVVALPTAWEYMVLLPANVELPSYVAVTV
jgi:hypothetical protein